MKTKRKAGRFPKHPSGNAQRVNLTLDPEVYEEASKLLHGSGVSVSEKVNELLKLHVVQKEKRAH